VKYNTFDFLFIYHIGYNRRKNKGQEVEKDILSDFKTTAGYVEVNEL